jgi:hypothetical protein
MQKKGQEKRETFGDFKRELSTIWRDIKEARSLFAEEFINFFNFKGDNILKVYIFFVLIILPIVLTMYVFPIFFPN